MLDARQRGLADRPSRSAGARPRSRSAKAQASASSRQSRMPPRSLSAAAACSRWACGSAARRGSTASATAAASASLQVTSVAAESEPCSASVSRSQREQHRIGRVVGDDQALARPLQHVRRHAVLARPAAARRSPQGCPGRRSCARAGSTALPSAAAAMPLGPLTRQTSRRPELRGDVEVGRDRRGRSSAAAGRARRPAARPRRRPGRRDAP